MSENDYLRNYTGPILAIFSPNESILGANDRSESLFSDISRDVAIATNFVE